MNTKYSQIISFIKKTSHILLFHHINPDFDTYSCVFAFYHWLKINFPTKQVGICLDTENLKSEFFNDYVQEQQPQQNSKMNFTKETTIAFVFDVCQYTRIFQNNFLFKAGTKIVFDHHSVGGDYFDLEIIKPNAVSTTQMLTDFFNFLEPSYEFTEQVAHFLFYGLVTDTGRFLYLNNEPSALITGAALIARGAKPTEIYQDLLTTTLALKRFMGYVLSNFKIAEKLAYIVISDETLKVYSVTRNEASSFVYLLAQIKDVTIHALITENTDNHCYSVSLRSKDIPVNEFAREYHGGGHKLAAGLKLADYKAVKKMLPKLQAYSLTNDK